jgi:pimeloyl-ACP methyl ester carboxylesterase
MSFSDGRSLANTDLGASSSPLVMSFYGAPTSRLDLVPFEGALTALDVRVVSADRPGYGGSSPRPDAAWRTGRRMSPPWPAISASNGSPSWDDRQVGPTPWRVRPWYRAESPAPVWCAA